MVRLAVRFNWDPRVFSVGTRGRDPLRAPAGRPARRPRCDRSPDRRLQRWHRQPPPGDRRSSTGPDLDGRGAHGDARRAARGDRPGARLRQPARAGSVELVRSGSSETSATSSNPTDRCYWCKTNLYDAVAELRHSGVAPRGRRSSAVRTSTTSRSTALARRGRAARGSSPLCRSGASTRRPSGHVARHLELGDAELPASPCLASRLYTGTRVDGCPPASDRGG